MTQAEQRELIPLRALNQVSYCPRPYYLEYVESVVNHGIGRNRTKKKWIDGVGRNREAASQVGSRFSPKVGLRTTVLASTSFRAMVFLFSAGM
jgi:hypothetical protein